MSESLQQGSPRYWLNQVVVIASGMDCFTLRWQVQLVAEVETLFQAVCGSGARCQLEVNDDTWICRLPWPVLRPLSGDQLEQIYHTLQQKFHGAKIVFQLECNEELLQGGRCTR